VTVSGYRIDLNHYHGKAFCLAGGRKVCARRPEFLLHFAYTKSITTKDGARSEIEVVANRPACREHAEKFAKKHKVGVPAVLKRSR